MGKQVYLYHDKPLFGLDIGYNSISVLQLSSTKSPSRSLPKLQGYGSIDFDGSAIKDGVVNKPKVIVEALEELFKNHLLGKIDTRRVALTIPSYRTFSRTVNLPKLKPKELEAAAIAEAEQYVPMPLSELYLDYEIIKKHKDSLDILIVALPKKIADSYTRLTNAVSLEPVLIETSMHSAARLFGQDRDRNEPTIIIDFGSMSSDIALVDNQKIIVMGTVQGGGEVFNETIAKSLDISLDAATIIKNKYGLGVSKKQHQITSALSPTLDPIIKEIRRILRYYEDRFPKAKPIGQVFILGSGSSMPGLSDYLTDHLRLPSRTCDSWQYLSYGRVKAPTGNDKYRYATVSGLALANPTEVFD